VKVREKSNKMGTLKGPFLNVVSSVGNCTRKSREKHSVFFLIFDNFGPFLDHGLPNCLPSEFFIQFCLLTVLYLKKIYGITLNSIILSLLLVFPTILLPLQQGSSTFQIVRATLTISIMPAGLKAMTYTYT
jgi:hypothetical protein